MPRCYGHIVRMKNEEFVKIVNLSKTEGLFSYKNLFGHKYIPIWPKYIQPYYRDDQLQYIKLIFNSMKDISSLLWWQTWLQWGIPHSLPDLTREAHKTWDEYSYRIA